MKYRLDKLSRICSENGVECRRIEEHRLDVALFPGCFLSFCNLVEEEDTLIGFQGLPWHFHGHLILLDEKSKYLELDEIDVLIGLLTGELLVVSQFWKQELKDRWILHRKQSLDCKYLEPGEEIRVFRRA